jgi:peptide/nickel transport system ATP-binding protein
MSAVPLLDVKNLEQRYMLPRESLFRPPGQVRALNGVSVQVQAGKSLGIVGESGSGKSTFARVVMALERPTAGEVTLLGRDLNRISPDELRRARRDFQMVFQDPYGSLDPRQTIARIVAEPLTVLDDADRTMFRACVATVLKQVGLREADMDKYPHEFSGGQRQRIAIARALITQPRILILDEATAALDAESEAAIQANMAAIARGRTVMIIAHRLSALRLADRIVTMENGAVTETGTHESLLAAGGRYAQLWRLQMEGRAA